MGRVAQRARHQQVSRGSPRPHVSQVCLPMRPATLGDVIDVDIEKDEMLVLGGHHVRYAPFVADIQKRGSYTPRRAREQRAYRLVVAGGVAGTVGVVTLVLALANVIGAGIPAIALIVAAICLVLFRQTVSGR